jgi:hypothetical protein
VNREKPFTDALRVALLSGGGRRLRIIAERLAQKAEQGDLGAIQQIADRLDGKPSQAIERGDLPLEVMTDQQLMAIIRGGSRELIDEPSYARICGPVPAKYRSTYISKIQAISSTYPPGVVEWEGFEPPLTRSSLRVGDEYSITMDRENARASVDFARDLTFPGYLGLQKTSDLRVSNAPLANTVASGSPSRTRPTRSGDNQARWIRLLT